MKLAGNCPGQWPTRPPTTQVARTSSVPRWVQRGCSPRPRQVPPAQRNPGGVRARNGECWCATHTACGSPGNWPSTGRGGGGGGVAVGPQRERAPDPTHRRLAQPAPPSHGAFQCVAARGVLSSVSRTTCSTCESVIFRGAPGRGSSSSPATRFATNRRRQRPTVWRVTRASTATALLSRPLTHASTMRARCARACAVVGRRAQRSSVSRSSSLSVNGAFGRPRRIGVLLVYTENASLRHLVSRSLTQDTRDGSSPRHCYLRRVLTHFAQLLRGTENAVARASALLELALGTIVVFSRALLEAPVVLDPLERRGPVTVVLLHRLLMLFAELLRPAVGRRGVLRTPERERRVGPPEVPRLPVAVLVERERLFQHKALAVPVGVQTPLGERRARRDENYHERQECFHIVPLRAVLDHSPSGYTLRKPRASSRRPWNSTRLRKAPVFLLTKFDGREARFGQPDLVLISSVGIAAAAG